MKNGLKKWVIRFEGGIFVCDKCHKAFVSENFKNIRRYKYGKNLIKWSINQHICYRISFKKITDILLDSFNIKVSTTAMYEFKSKLAKEYQEVYQEIIKNIINGNLIHADETQAKIKGLSGYVWVFTNMDSVYYLFRPTREADFLKDLLNEFNGVLISDFYTGYDALPCPQQKCLVHLIRDLNEDLFKNQLNTEYKTIVTEFGKLLRKIMETINRYGLKKRHLNKHHKDIDKFYIQNINKEYESELAMKYQKRFKKYRNKLFMFLNYDGIPWNNNNAEHAIKPFAAYRRNISATFSESGLNNYLVLLSLQQTCQYRGLSFLDFLRSGETNFEKFCNG